MVSNGTTQEISAVDFSFRIVEEIRECDGATVPSLASEFDVSNSTIYRHLTTLRKHGYVVEEDGEYHVGLRFLEPGISARRRRAIHQLAGEKTRQIAAETGERAQYIVEENGLGVHMFCEVGEKGIRTRTIEGTQVPLHTISVGKAILAHLPEDRVDEIIREHGLPSYTENTITDRTELKDELETIRAEGVAYNRSERISDIYSVGVPVLDPDGMVHGGFSVTGPSRRIHDQRLVELEDMLLSTAEEVELRIQYSEL